MIELNEANFILLAAKDYNNPSCLSSDEFYEDLARFKYLKRLFRRWRNLSLVNDRLLLNHIIVLCNVFGIKRGIEFLFFKIEPEDHSALKTCLYFLHYIKPTEYSNIQFDNVLYDILISNK